MDDRQLLADLIAAEDVASGLRLRRAPGINAALFRFLQNADGRLRIILIYILVTFQFRRDQNADLFRDDRFIEEHDILEEQRVHLLRNLIVLGRPADRLRQLILRIISVQRAVAFPHLPQRQRMRGFKMRISDKAFFPGPAAHARIEKQQIAAVEIRELLAGGKPPEIHRRVSAQPVVINHLSVCHIRNGTHSAAPLCFSENPVGISVFINTHMQRRRILGKPRHRHDGSGIGHHKSRARGNGQALNMNRESYRTALDMRIVRQ